MGRSLPAQYPGNRGGHAGNHQPRAIWTSTSPDFGEASVVERFGQTRPRVLFAVDGYRYNGKAIDIQDKVARVVRPDLTA